MFMFILVFMIRFICFDVVVVLQEVVQHDRCLSIVAKLSAGDLGLSRFPASASASHVVVSPNSRAGSVSPITASSRSHVISASLLLSPPAA
jgi:hypothetical protein